MVVIDPLRYMHNQNISSTANARAQNLSPAPQGTRPVIRKIQKDQDRFCPCVIIYKIDIRTEILHPGFPYTSRFP